MNPIARDLNQIIEKGNPHLMEMLSDMGKNLFFPKGILSQSAEAREKAHKLNATIGIATERGRTMHFSSVMDSLSKIRPEDSLTYAPSFGIPALRKAWRDSLFIKNPSLVGRSISLPVVTCGITHAISMFADMWLNPRDVVILPEMMWGNYNMILNVKKGADLSTYTLFFQNKEFNLKAFEKQVETEAKKRDKISVLLNFPHNPSGYSVTQKEGERIAEILAETADKGTNVLAVFDDSYFGLFYEDQTMKESLFASLCERHPKLLAIKVDGATKESFVWGLRVGFITYGGVVTGDNEIIYDALERKTAGSIRGSISNASHLGQTVVLKSLQSDNYAAEKEQKFKILKNRAMRVKEVLENPKYRGAWDVYPFNSGYFMCLRLKSVNSETLRLHLLEKYGVGLIAMGEKDLRIAFSCLEENDILELFDIVLQGIKDLNGSGTQ
jgi:aspartate/methionine/tyrosine aminotransferase